MHRHQALGYVAVGIIVTTLAALVIGAGRTEEPRIGRFQISACNHHAYIIDTTTGVVWDHQIHETDGDWGPGEFHANKLEPQKP
jgi:hypothetical protein